MDQRTRNSIFFSFSLCFFLNEQKHFHDTFALRMNTIIHNFDFKKIKIISIVFLYYSGMEN